MNDREKKRERVRDIHAARHDDDDDDFKTIQFKSKNKSIQVTFKTIILNNKQIQHDILYPQDYNYILHIIIIFILLLDLKWQCLYYLVRINIQWNIDNQHSMIY